MNQAGTRIRPGSPTQGEGLACARLLDMAAEGFFKVLLGGAAPQIHAQAYVETGNEYSCENTLFAEDDGQIAGMAVGFPALQRKGFSKNPIASCEGYPRIRASALSFVFSPMLRILDSLADGDFYLLSLAVDADHRGRGLGSTLIEAMEGRAREAGATRFSLDVAAKNDGAQKVYRRHGFETYARWPRCIHLRRLGLYRMAKELNDV